MRKITLLILLLSATQAHAQSWITALSTYVRRVDSTITTKTTINSITPSTVGNRIVELSNLLKDARYSDTSYLTLEDTNIVATKRYTDSAVAKGALGPTDRAKLDSSFNRSLRAVYDNDSNILTGYATPSYVQQNGVSSNDRAYWNGAKLVADTARANNTVAVGYDTSTGALFVTIKGDTASTRGLTRIYPAYADTNTSPANEITFYFAAQAGRYRNFLRSSGAAILVSDTNALGVVLLIRSDQNSWVKDTIGLPGASGYYVKDSILQFTGRLASFPFLPKQSILSNRNVREGIIHLEIYDTVNQYYLRRIGNYTTTQTGTIPQTGGLSGWTSLQFCKLGETTVSLGGYANGGSWAATATTDTTAIVPLYNGTTLGGYAVIDWSKVANGATTAIASSTSTLSRMVARSAPIRDNRTGYTPLSTRYDQGIWTNQSTLNTLNPDIYQLIENVELYGPDTSYAVSLRLFGYRLGTNRDSFRIGFKRNGNSRLSPVTGGNSFGDVAFVGRIPVLDTALDVVSVALTAQNTTAFTGGRIWMRMKGMNTVNTLTFTGADTMRAVLKASTWKVASTNALPWVDRPLFPPKLYTVTGYNLPIYSFNSFMGDDITKSGNRQYAITISSQKKPVPITYQSAVMNLNTADFTDKDTAMFYVSYKDNDTLYYRFAEINETNPASLASKTGKLCIFGNSITANGVVDTMYKRINTESGANVSFVGTGGNSTIRQEAKPSASYNVFLGRETSYGADENGAGGSNWIIDSTSRPTGGQPRVNIGTLRVYRFDTIPSLQDSNWVFQYSPSIGTTKNREYSLTEAVRSGNHASFIASGGKYVTFRPDRFFATTGESVGLTDTTKLVVICNLGFNDINHAVTLGKGDTGLYDALEGIRIFVTRLNKWKPGIPIGISPITAVNKTMNWSQFSPFIERAMVLIDSFNAVSGGNYNVSFMPTYLSINRISAYNFFNPYGPANAVDYPISPTNTGRKGLGSDGFHPSPWAGKKEMANVQFYWLAWQISKL